MTDREKLIQILSEDNAYPKCEDCKTPIGYCNRCVVEIHADHLIASGVTFHKWVPVALGFLPEEPGRYLCRVKSFAFPGNFYYAILQYDKGGFREGNIYTDDVAYWMPLPEPPKEVE